MQIWGRIIAIALAVFIASGPLLHQLHGHGEALADIIQPEVGKNVELPDGPSPDAADDSAARSPCCFICQAKLSSSPVLATMEFGRTARAPHCHELTGALSSPAFHPPRLHLNKV